MSVSAPDSDGYRMPGEFERHGGGTWMVWPTRRGTWRNDCVPAREAFAEVAKAISMFETVSIIVSSDQYASARALLPRNIRLIEMSSNDSWARDIGPTFVKNAETGEVRGVDWTFNAWGGVVDGLYKDFALDDAVAGKICQIERLESYRLENFVLEGGSIHVDGEGTCITTEACLLSAGRNPSMTKQEIEAKLRAYLGVRCVIWLPRGIHLDETNEHVDNIVHFIGPARVVLAWTDDQSDPQYSMSAAALSVLEGARDAQGRRFSITKLHTPGPLYVTADEGASFGTCDPICKAGDRLPASYANFYMCNGGVIVPTFGDSARDAAALETLRELMPDRQVVGVYSREILLGGGNIHCITQQQP